jgi:mannose-6-phosphate isomerase
MSNVQQHAMPWHMEDGSPVSEAEREKNIDTLLAELHPASRPDFQPGLRIAVSDEVERVICCAGRYFALERWRVAAGVPLRYRFEHATILSNVGLPAVVRSASWAEQLERAASLLLPAALREIEIMGPADVFIGYLPNLEHDVYEPLAAAGYGRGVIQSLGAAFDA